MPGNLVLSRKTGESITIQVPPSPHWQEVVVVFAEQCHPGKVRLATQAEPEVMIDRTEILERRSA